MRTLTALVLALLFAVPAASSTAAQELERPPDWKVRFDRPDAGEDDLETFVAMPPGWHLTTGPAGIFWDPALTASGPFRLEADIYLFDPAGRKEAFGVFFGGSDLEGPAQSYTYFLIREGGEFILKERDGAEAPTLQGWTADEAIRSFADRDAGDSSVLNRLAVEARTEAVRFFVNGTEVASLPRSELPVEGRVGIRVNHRLDLHVARLEVRPLG